VKHKLRVRVEREDGSIREEAFFFVKAEGNAQLKSHFTRLMNKHKENFPNWYRVEVLDVTHYPEYK
jgi:hypothetical protein